MMVSNTKALVAIGWQGALLLLALLMVATGVYGATYHLSWGQDPHWIEAFRDRRNLVNLLENTHWPWIHQDTQYWIIRVRFDHGPVTLAGRPPVARYWSVTYYAALEDLAAEEAEASFTTKRSLNMGEVELETDGTYRIIFTKAAQPETPNQIIVHPGLNRGIIELRITLQAVGEPVHLPEVWQQGSVLVQGGAQ